MRDIRKQVNNMDRDNKREITISIPESIYEELQGAAKQLSGWEREQLQGTEREISDSWEPEDVVTAAVITWLSERGGDEMSILTITIIAIIVNFVLGIIAGWISKDGHVAIGAAIIADLILVAVYAL